MAPNDASPTEPVSPLENGEIEAFFQTDAAAFGAYMTKGFREVVEKIMSVDRIAVSRDGTEVVGTAASEPSQMTLPGLTTVPVAMVVGVSVIPSHRRQGRLNSLMRYQLDDVRARGELIATLFASEGGIYGRFGYGQATFGSTYTIDKRVARLARPVRDSASGRVRLVTHDQAAEAFPAVWAAYCPTRAGELTRGEIGYMEALGEPGDEDVARRFYAVYEEDGRIDGYVAYEVAAFDDPNSRERRVIVHELCSLTAGSYVALWGFLLGIDLTTEIRAHHRPVDEPLRWMLADPRQLRVARSSDRSWVRLMEVGANLAGRHYAQAGKIVIDVEDAFCPWNAGKYEVVVSEDWGPAEVVRTEAAADIVVDVSTLGSMYLGGVSAMTFAAAGRIGELAPGATLRADRMFANDRPPFCMTSF